MTIPKSTSKVLYGTSKVLQRYFEGTPRYYESTVEGTPRYYESTMRYLVFEGTSVYHEDISAVRHVESRRECYATKAEERRDSTLE